MKEKILSLIKVMVKETIAFYRQNSHIFYDNNLRTPGNNWSNEDLKPDFFSKRVSPKCSIISQLSTNAKAIKQDDHNDK